MNYKRNALILLLLINMPLSSAKARQSSIQDPEKLWNNFLSESASAQPSMTFPFDSCFRQAAEEQDLPLSLLLAVARGESDFDPKAKSDKNCHGIMQIQWPGTAKHLGITRQVDLYHPCTNIRAGAKYLRELLDRYNGDLHLALAAYNYGPGRIGKSASKIPAGANWYSGYIYHHLQTVLQGADLSSNKNPHYQPAGKIQVIVFNKANRAASFLEYVQQKAPAVRLDLFRMGLGRFSVVLLYGNEGELDNGKKILNNLGFKL